MKLLHCRSRPPTRNMSAGGETRIRISFSSRDRPPDLASAMSRVFADVDLSLSRLGSSLHVHEVQDGYPGIFPVGASCPGQHCYSSMHRRQGGWAMPPTVLSVLSSFLIGPKLSLLTKTLNAPMFAIYLRARSTWVYQLPYNTSVYGSAGALGIEVVALMTRSTICELPRSHKPSCCGQELAHRWRIS